MKKLTRRRLLVGGGAMAALGTMGAAASQTGLLTYFLRGQEDNRMTDRLSNLVGPGEGGRANSELARISKTAPGLLSFNRFYVQDARAAIIHLRNFHAIRSSVFFGRDGIPEVDLSPEVRYSQSNQVMTLNYLTESGFLRTLFLEGAWPGDYGAIDEHVARIARTHEICLRHMERARLAAEDWHGGPGRAEAGRLQRLALHCENELSEYLLMEAETRLYIENELDLEYVDNVDLLRAAMEIRMRAHELLLSGDAINSLRAKALWGEYIEINEQRETEAIEILARRPELLLFVKFGRRHTFADNIEQWNRRHPEHRFSFGEMDFATGKPPTQLKDLML